MKSWLMVPALCATLLIGTVHADETSKTALAHEFLDLTGATAGVKQSIDSVDTFFLPTIRPGTRLEGIDVSSPAFWKTFKRDQAANLQALKQKLQAVMLAPVMKLSEEELKEAVRFYRSPTGKKVIGVFYDRQGLFETRAKTLRLISDMVKTEAHLLAQAQAKKKKGQ